MHLPLIKTAASDTGIRKHEYVPSLDGVRAISVLIVLLVHGGVLRGYGNVGVDMFFVLSGFLITTILVNEYDRNGSILLINFYRRRTLRLFPALLLMCSLFIVYAVLFLPDLKTRSLETVEALFYVSNWSRAFALGTSQYLGHTWSLGIEEQFYLLWPLLLIASLPLARGRAVALFLAVAIAVVCVLWRIELALHGASVMRLYNGFDTRCDSVLIGCALAFIGPRLGFLWPLGLIGLWFSSVLSPWSNPLVAATYSVVPLCCALVIAGALKKDGYLARALSFTPLVAIGRISYGLYLFHFPIYTIVAQKIGGSFIYYNAISLSLTFLVAALSYRYIERPCLTIRNDTSWSGSQYLAFLGPACLALGSLYIVWMLAFR